MFLLFQRKQYRVVKPHERDVKLRSDEVIVVSRIGDYCDSFLIARQILFVRTFSSPENKSIAFSGIVKVWVVLRTIAVHTVQVKTRRSEVPDHVGVCSPLTAGRGIECDVMGDELTQIRVSRWDFPVQPHAWWITRLLHLFSQRPKERRRILAGWRFKRR